MGARVLSPPHPSRILQPPGRESWLFCIPKQQTLKSVSLRESSPFRIFPIYFFYVTICSLFKMGVRRRGKNEKEQALQSVLVQAAPKVFSLKWSCLRSRESTSRAEICTGPQCHLGADSRNDSLLILFLWILAIYKNGHSGSQDAFVPSLLKSAGLKIHDSEEWETFGVLG